MHSFPHNRKKREEVIRRPAVLGLQKDVNFRGRTSKNKTLRTAGKKEHIDVPRLAEEKARLKQPRILLNPSKIVGHGHSLQATVEKCHGSLAEGWHPRQHFPEFGTAQHGKGFKTCATGEEIEVQERP